MSIARTEGLPALWKGLIPRLARTPPGQAIVWTVSDQVGWGGLRGWVRGWVGGGGEAAARAGSASSARRHRHCRCHCTPDAAFSPFTPQITGYFEQQRRADALRRS